MTEWIETGWRSSSKGAAHLTAVAYRMFGSLAEADGAVQESWLRPAAPTQAATSTSAGSLAGTSLDIDLEAAVHRVHVVSFAD